MSDSEFDREMAEALENAETAEVVCIILPTINQCLVYDSRSGPNDPPRVSVSPPLGSGERRLRHVNKARPNLERARELAVLPWTGSISAFANSRIWGMLTERIQETGIAECRQEAEGALDELKQWERRSLMAMIKGQGPFHTLWSRS